MGVYFRKIQLNKWPKDGNPYDDVSRIPAEPVTRDLAANENTFSLWCFKCEEEEEIALTIALSMPRIDDLQLIFLRKDEIENKSLLLAGTKGKTDYRKNIDAHFDIIDMDYESVGKVAHLVIASINEKRVRQIRKKKLVEILHKRIEEGVIDFSDLKEAIQKQYIEVYPNEAGST